jgi:chemotaxis protein CheX
VARVAGELLHQPDKPAAVEEAHGIVGTVRLRGTWNGVVALACPMELARQAAAIMFAVEPGAITEEQARDALGELTNMVAGNLKSLLPGPTSLELPTVLEEPAGAGSVTGSRPWLQAAFECAHGPFSVNVFASDVKP